MSEFWDLLNIQSKFNCHRAALRTAKRVAKSREEAILIRHHGPRPNPNKDPTRVNYYVWPDGQIDRRQENGQYVDVA